MKTLPELKEETIHCIYGPPGSGKSTLCFQYLIEILKQNKKVYFIDTESGISIERIKQIDSNINLKNLIIFKPRKFEEQNSIIKKLINQISKNYNLGLIVVDSLVMLYRLKLGEKPFNINQTLAEQLRILREIGIKNKIPIIVTNQMYKDFETNESRMVGGSILAYWCKIIIELEKENNSRKLILKKHKHISEQKPIGFRIENKGLILKKSFFSLH